MQTTLSRPSIPTLWSDVKKEFKTAAWKRSLLLWLVLNVILSGMGVLAWRLHSPIRPANPDNLWGVTPIDAGWQGALEGVWLRWDAVHYYRIVTQGYSSEEISVFFPLYPLLGRAACRLLGGDELAGLLLVSRLAFLLALVTLYKLAAEKFGDESATYSILFAALYPMGVYWFAPYPLSLALLFVLLSLRSALKKRWLAAALAGLAAGLTHSTTLPLALALLVIWILQVRREKRAWWLLPAVGSPPLGTALFFAWRIHQGFAPIEELLAKYWVRVMQPPWMVVGDFQRFADFYTGFADGWVNLMLFLFSIAMLVVCIRRLEPALWIYQPGLIVYLCTTTNFATPFCSYGRYLMMSFPIYLALPLVAKGKRARMLLVSLGLISMLFLAIVYLEWGWLA